MKLFDNFTDRMGLTDVTVVTSSKKSGLGKGALAGIILGTIAVAVTLSAIVSILILRKHLKDRHHTISRRRRCEYLPIINRKKVIVLIDKIRSASREAHTKNTAYFLILTWIVMYNLHI